MITIIKPISRYYFDCACDGLVKSVQLAADPSKDDWYPYYGDTVTRAVCDARRVHRQARNLGLIPSTAELEAESRRVA